MLHKSLWIQNVQRHMGWQWSVKSAKKKGNQSLKMLEIHPAIRGDWFLWKNLMSLVAKHPCWLIKCVASYPVLNLNCPILTKKQTLLARKHQTFCRCIACVIPLSVTVPHLTLGLVQQREPSMSMLLVLNKWNISTHLQPKQEESSATSSGCKKHLLPCLPWSQCPENSFATCCSLLIQPLRQGKCNS